MNTGKENEEEARKWSHSHFHLRFQTFRACEKFWQELDIAHEQDTRLEAATGPHARVPVGMLSQLANSGG